jgi:hypothetical protein
MKLKRFIAVQNSSSSHTKCWHTHPKSSIISACWHVEMLHRLQMSLTNQMSFHATA